MLVFWDASLKLGALRESLLSMDIHINLSIEGVADYKFLPKINTELEISSYLYQFS